MLPVLKVLPLLALVGAVPLVQEAAFIGEGTNELASALLEGHLSQNENMVFSPLAYNALLALFAEGARGTTREEIAAALHFPNDPQAVRQAYQSTLKRLSKRNQPNVPEMMNWFYIYKNYTVDEGLKDILREYYLTEVKSVERPSEFLNKKEQITKVKVPSGLQGKPTDHLINVDKDVEDIIEAASSPHKSDGEEASNSKTPAEEKPKEKPVEDVKNEVLESDEALNKVEKIDEVKAEPEVVAESEKLPGSSNSDEKIQLSEEEQLKLKTEEKKPIEVSEEQVKVEPVAESVEKVVQATVEDISDNPDKPNVEEMSGDSKKVIEEQVVSAAVMPVEPVASVNEKKEKVEEMMLAMQRSMETVDDMSGMTDSAVTVKGKDRDPKLIVFNGLYFIGNWNTQFVKKPADDAKPFYKANNEKVFVKTLHAEGLFPTADLPDINSRAVEFLYEGGRYSLLVVVPKAVDGLEKLTSDLSNYPVSKICQQLTEKLIDVCLPTFMISTISSPVNASKQIGFSNVKSLFNPETSDLSGITSQPGLFVEELVQYVTLQVDSNYTETNFFAASLASSRSDLEKFQVNQPFLFFLRDNVDDIIIVNGKVVDPTPPVDDFRSSIRRHF